MRWIAAVAGLAVVVYGTAILLVWLGVNAYVVLMACLAIGLVAGIAAKAIPTAPGGVAQFSGGVAVSDTRRPCRGYQPINYERQITMTMTVPEDYRSSMDEPVAGDLHCRTERELRRDNVAIASELARMEDT